MNTRLASAAAAALALGLAACGGPPPPPPPTTVTLTLQAAPDLNGGLPAQVKVYWLRGTERFESADFFAVFDAPEATLGPDLAAVDDHLLSPGETVEISRSFDQPATAPAAVGVVAGFRRVDRPGWSASAPLTPNAANVRAVSLGAAEVSFGD